MTNGRLRLGEIPTTVWLYCCLRPVMVPPPPFLLLRVTHRLARPGTRDSARL